MSYFTMSSKNRSGFELWSLMLHGNPALLMAVLVVVLVLFLLLLPPPLLLLPLLLLLLQLPLLLLPLTAQSLEKRVRVSKWLGAGPTMSCANLR
jgi:hypothetical protein